jgi:Zn-dependent peptidase ImmA (M78 family)
MGEDEPAVHALCQHHHGVDPEALILRLCRELLAEKPTDSGPTPLHVLGSRRCIREIQYAPLAIASGCSGLLVLWDGGYYVTLDEDEPPGRRHRSLAHEIVHTFFREVCPGPAGPYEEQLCEVGAAELTMPADRARRFMPGSQAITFDIFNKCAQEFGVTNDAAARRLVDLSDQPVCYLVATKRRTKQQDQFDVGKPQLRVASWASSRSWPDQKPYRGLAFHPNSLIGRAFDEQDFRAGRARLGTSHRDGVFNIEAWGYTFYPRGHARSRVAALLRT